MENEDDESEDAVADRDETLAERIQRFKSNFAAYGLRGLASRVFFCLLEYPFKHLFFKVGLCHQPRVLLLQVKNSFFKLPGGSLRPGERDTDGLRRKLSRKLSLDDNGVHDDWQIGQCIGMWWKSEFETLPFPYLPPNTLRPKECIKLFLVRLPMTRQFVVPKNLKLLAVPLCQIHDNAERYMVQLYLEFRIYYQSSASISSMFDRSIDYKQYVCFNIPV